MNSVKTEWLGPTTMSTSFIGLVDEAAVAAFIDAAESAFRRNVALSHFVSFAHATGYTTSARRQLTDYALSRRSLIDSVAFLLGENRLLGMGVTTAALALQLSGVRVALVTSAKEFDARLALATERGVRRGDAP